MKGMRHILWLCTLFIMVCAWACTQVETVDMSDRPSTSLLKMSFNWNGEDADKPNRLHVIAARKIMTWRAHGYVDTDHGNNPWFGFTQPIIEEGAVEPDTLTNDSIADSLTIAPNDTTTRYPFRLKGGEYSMLVVNCGDSWDNMDLKCLRKENNDTTGTDDTSLNAYLTDNTRKASELFLCIRPLDEKPDVVKDKDLPDFNPKFEYITDVPRIFYGLQTGINVVPGLDTEVLLDMEPISQEVQIVFTIELNGNIQLIEAPIVEMSGICGQFNLMDEYVDTTKLYRSAVISELESQSGNLLVYKARFHTLGIIPSVDSTYLNGPGVFQVAVRAVSTSPGTTNTEGRYVYAGINPHTELSESQVIVMDENGKPRLRFSREPVIVNVEKHLVINEDFLIDSGKGLGWEQHDPDNDINIDI